MENSIFSTQSVLNPIYAMQIKNLFVKLAIIQIQKRKQLPPPTLAEHGALHPALTSYVGCVLLSEYEDSSIQNCH